MSVSELGEQPNRSRRTDMDFVASKLHRPLARPGIMHRFSLIERLVRGYHGPIVSVVAPAGYGKTTLLSQWAERTGQACAWVSVDERDNDPKVFFSYVAEALDAIEPIDQRVFDALASPGSSVLGSVVPRLASAFASMTTPTVLVLDDVYLLHDSECRAGLSVLADHATGGSQLVLAGRSEPPLRIARLRAEGRILEIGAADLALTREEASALLRAAEVALDDDDIAELHRRTEGWAAGLYLAALYLRDGGSLRSAAGAFGGDDRFVSEYMESELLARLSPSRRAFLIRTAVLERMSGPLCEAVLDLPGSAAMLAALAQSNMLLVPLDRHGQWYRYHHLFRDMLLAELDRHEPGLAPVLRRRAAGWCMQNGLLEEAVEYSIAAEDLETVVRLVEQRWVLVYRRGGHRTLERWFRWLEDRGVVKGHPVIAVFASGVFAVTGHPVEAERWADIVDHWQYQDPDWPGDSATEAWAAMLRALLCRRGVEQLRTDAEEAARKFTAAGIVLPNPDFYRGQACVLAGDIDGSDEFFQAAAATAEQLDAQEMLLAALCGRSMVAMARGDWSHAEVLADHVRTALRRRDGPEEIVAWAVQARVAMHRGDLPAVRQALVNAQRLRPTLTYGLPMTAVQTRIELARVYLALDDTTAARTLVREIDEVLRHRPGLGTLVGQAQELRTQLARERRPNGHGASSLTTAELRLLPMLATYLSGPEIAAELFLSPHTVKSQQGSLYRKLEVSSRRQAVARAHELGLLDG